MSVIPEYATAGTFEMATLCGYSTTKAYLVGALAVHKNGREWTISHAATGMGIGGWGNTLEEACRVARGVDAAIDWSSIKRTKEIGVARGLTRKKRAAVAAMLCSFRHIAQRRIS